MGMFWGVTFSSGVPKQLAPNDGTDSQLLPLEELPVPPWILPDAILRAWQPNITVQVLDPPGSGIQETDDPPKKQSFGALETIQRAWQKTWPAQTYANNAAWNLPGLPPRFKPLQPTWPRESWSVQSAPDIAATYLDPVPPQPAQPVVWRNPVWSAQRAIASNAWDVVADQPPFLPQPPTILSAWQTSYRVTVLGPVGGASATTPDNPPRLALPRADALWKITWAAQNTPPNAAWNTPAQQVDNPPRMALPLPDGKAWQQRWSAQSAPPNAAWNFTAAAVDNPPPAGYPQQVFRAWQPDVRITLLGPTGGSSQVAADNPPPKQDYGQQRITALWAQTWSAQTYADNAGWNFVLATPDNPPPPAGYPQQVFRAWQPEVRVTLLKPTGGDSVGPVDNPPFGRRQPDASGSWYATWKSLDVVTAGGIDTGAVDDPPPLKRDWLYTIVGQSPPAWRAQKAAPSAAWNVVPPVIDNPPPTQGYGLYQTLPKWQQTWSAQSYADNAAWNFTPPDNPPVRQDFARQQVVASWQMRWPAQGPGQTAAWNFVPPVIDNPPVRNQYSAGQIVAKQWEQNWLAQSRSPIGWIFPEPIPDATPPPQFDNGSRSGSGGGEPVKKKKKPTPIPIQRRAGAKNTFVSLDSGQVYDKAQRVAKQAPAQIISEADAIEEQEAAEILALLEKLFDK